MNKDVLEAATEENIIKCVRKREFPAFDYQRADGTLEKIAGKKLEEFNNKVKVGKIAIAPNGSMFSTEVIGVIAAVVKYVFNKRVEYKNKMKATNEILSTPSLSKELATILEEIKNKKVTKKVYF